MPYLFPVIRMLVTGLWMLDGTPSERSSYPASSIQHLHPSVLPQSPVLWAGLFTILILSFLGNEICASTVSRWTEKPTAVMKLSTFRSDRSLSFSITGRYQYAVPWSPLLRWETRGKLYNAGTLNREKRDGRFLASLRFKPRHVLSLSLKTEGWRRKDTGTQIFERTRGASAKGTVTIDFSQNSSMEQSGALVRDVVATTGLGGEEHDNGGVESLTKLNIKRMIGWHTFLAGFERSFSDLRLHGRDDRTLSLRLLDQMPNVDVQLYDRQKRYQSGAEEEFRNDKGGNARLTVDLGPVGRRTLTCDYSVGSGKTVYEKGTNQDFVSSNEQLNFQLEPLRHIDWAKARIKVNLKHMRYEEVNRTVYDREEIGRRVEAHMETAVRDSAVGFSVDHSLSLNKSIYSDLVNFSDHDIRDQKLAAGLVLRAGSSDWRLKLTRRRNDLVYVDAERSANTSSTNEYVGSLKYGLTGRRWRWTQSFLISARYAHYRFRPDRDELSRRGQVDSKLRVAQGDVECELFQKWLWDDNGPYNDDVFRRSELTEEIEMGVAVVANAGPWSIGPGWRQRRRSIYGPRGRNGGVIAPSVNENWLSLDARCPFWGSGKFSLSTTMVLRRNAEGYMKASVAVENVW